MCDPAKTRALNDELRRTFSGGKIMMTNGLSSHPDHIRILNRVRTFNAFTEDNDPYGEHDFGAFDHAGDVIFFKIDYYDKDLSFGSPDPSDPEVTTRVMTIMLAAEY
jgi:uncharacterized protein DUF3768